MLELLLPDHALRGLPDYPTLSPPATRTCAGLVPRQRRRVPGGAAPRAQHARQGAPVHELRGAGGGAAAGACQPAAGGAVRGELGCAGTARVEVEVLPDSGMSMAGITSAEPCTSLLRCALPCCAGLCAGGGPQRGHLERVRVPAPGTAAGPAHASQSLPVRQAEVEVLTPTHEAPL